MVDVRLFPLTKPFLLFKVLTLPRNAIVRLADCSATLLGGSFFEGIACSYTAAGLVNHSACPAGGRCDVYSGTCIASNQQAQLDFVDCVMSGLTSYTQLLVK